MHNKIDKLLKLEKAKTGIEPILQDLQSSTLPIMLFSLLKDKEGFEPTVFFNTIVFKTNALNHSTTYPCVCVQFFSKRRDLNPQL